MYYLQKQKEKILLSRDNSLDYGVSEVIKVYASLQYIFASFFFYRHHLRMPIYCLQILFAYISSINRHLAAKSAWHFGDAK